MSIVFGTDGVRGEVGVTLSTSDALTVGKGIGRFVSKLDLNSAKYNDIISKKVYKNLCDIDKCRIDEIIVSGAKFVVVAIDSRASSIMIASSLIAGLNSQGVSVINVGRLGTAGLAFVAKCLGILGVMITASHNDYRYNGIKVFGSDGAKLSESDNVLLDRFVNSVGSTLECSADKCGCVVCAEGLSYLYYKYIKSKLSKGKKRKIVWDFANGVVGSYYSKIIPDFEIFDPEKQEYKSNNIIIGNNFATHNINKCYGATDIGNLSKTVQQVRADIGFAFDGDGDRLIIVDRFGNILDGDELMAILAIWLDKKNNLKNRCVVGTVMTNYGIESSLAKCGIKMIRSRVGDRFIWEIMNERSLILGAESSGHLIYSAWSKTGDAWLSASILEKMLDDCKKPLETIRKSIIIQDSVLLNVEVKAGNKNLIMENPKLTSLLKTAEEQLAWNGRILVRPSGTENIIRVLVEGEDKRAIKGFAEVIANRITSLDNELPNL